nr:hypothetical protein [Tanacetum cinerariifolium]
MMLYKQEEKCLPLSPKHGDWLNDTDDESDEQKFEAHYMYMEKIQEVLTADSEPTIDVEPLEQVQSNYDYNVFATKRQHPEQPETINDTYVVEMVNYEEQADQNAKEYKYERVVLASLLKI